MARRQHEITKLASGATNSPQQSPPRKQLLLAGMIWGMLLLFTLGSFWPLHQCNFVNYDDPDYVTENRHVLERFQWTTVKWAFQSREAGNWHPLTWLSHSLDCQAFGQNAGAHHLVNLGFHLINTLLVFVVFRQMSGAMWRPALLAALFALHPLHVESVAWISERKDVLSMLFFLLTIWAYARYVGVRSQPQESAWSGISVGWYIVALLLFALGLMSKPMLVTTPFVLLLLDYWPLERPEFKAGRAKPMEFLRLAREKVPFFVLSAVSCAITFLVQQQGGAVKGDLSRLERVENGVVSYARYIGLAFWPQKLSVIYPHPGQWPAMSVLASTLLLLLISAAVIKFTRTRRYFATGWLWFLGTLVPVIGLVQVGHQAMADRYTYLPLTGLFIVVVWAGADFIGMRTANATTSNFSPAGLAICLLVGTVGAALSNQQVRNWHDSETLFRHALLATKNNFLAHDKLALWLSDHGQSVEALEHYRTSLQINPDFGETQNNLGVELARRGEMEEATMRFRNATRLNPRLAAAHNNLGMALALGGHTTEAIQEYEESLRLKADDDRVQCNLAGSLAGLGRLDEAIRHYEAAAHLNPENPEIRLNLAKVLAQQGRREEAIAQCKEVLRRKPDNGPAQQALGELQSR